MRSPLFRLLLAFAAMLFVCGFAAAQNTYLWNASNALNGTGGNGTAWIRNGPTANATGNNWVNQTGGTLTIPGVTNNASVTVNGNVADVATFNLSGTLNSVIGMSNSTGNGSTGNGAANGLLSVGAIANISTTANTVNFSASSPAPIPPGILQLNGAYSGNTAGLSTTTLVSATGGDITFTRGTTNLLDVRLGIDGGVIAAAADRTVTFTSNITDGGNARGFVKDGAGTLRINGTSENTGNNTINAGKLEGTGTIFGATTVASGGIIEGGNAGVGELNLNSSVTVQSGGTMRAEIVSGTSDTLDLSGGTGARSLSLASGSNLNLEATTPTLSTTYTLANLGDAGLDIGGTTYAGDAVIATFTDNGASTVNGVNVNISGFDFASGGNQLVLQRSGNSLVLNFSPVPEPATLLAVCAVVVGGVAGVRRLRRKAVPADVTPAA